MRIAKEDEEAQPNLKSLARWLEGQQEGAVKLEKVGVVDDGPDEDDIPMTRSASRPTAGEMTPGSLDLDPPSRTGGCRGRPRSTLRCGIVVGRTSCGRLVESHGALANSRSEDGQVRSRETGSLAELGELGRASDHSVKRLCTDMVSHAARRQPPAAAGAVAVAVEAVVGGSIRTFLNARQCSLGLDDKEENRSS